MAFQAPGGGFPIAEREFTNNDYKLCPGFDGSSFLSFVLRRGTRLRLRHWRLQCCTFRGGFGGADLVGLSLYGGGEEERGGWVGTLHSAPCALSEGWLCSSGRPSALCVCTPRVPDLCYAARKGSAFMWVVKPLTSPRPSAAGRSGQELGPELGLPARGPGRVRGRGDGPGAPRDRGPLASPGQSLGPHQRPQGRASALRHAGVAGAEAGRVVFYDVGWPTPSQRQGSLPSPPREGHPAPAPCSVAGLPPACRSTPSGSIFQI